VAQQGTCQAAACTATSPKLSLAWTVADDLLLRASYGRGVRFPNVDELFNGTKTGSSITTSDPNLRPEVSRSFELAARKILG
jgi:iron complex outermembrane receptor protein